MEKLNERAMEAVKRYCENQGYEVLDDFEDAVVAKDGKELVFCEVQVRAYGDSLPIEDMDRGEVGIAGCAVPGRIPRPLRRSSAIRQLLAACRKQ